MSREHFEQLQREALLRERAEASERAIQGQMESTVLQSLHNVEKNIHTQMKKLEDVENMNDDDLELLRERRKAQMKRDRAAASEARERGHGSYQEVYDQKDFFAQVKRSKTVVVHFYRSATAACSAVDAALDRVARKHLETRFIKINAEKSPFLVEKLKIWMLPSIVLCVDGKTTHTITGLDEFGGTQTPSAAVVEAVLSVRGVLNERTYEYDDEHVISELDRDGEWYD